VCGQSSKRFGEFGLVPREDAQCLYCGSLERHRLTWLYFERMTNLFDRRPKHMLHVGPEPYLGKQLRKHLGSGYVSADINPGRAMVQMDIAEIQYPNETFDVIYCSHVLEHVPDDRRAISEFYRILKSDGWVVPLVPITADKTFEDASVIDPSDRLKLFGQQDHVRKYGADYVERLREVGFNVKVTSAFDFLQRDEAIRMGITRAAGEIYYCTKR